MKKILIVVMAILIVLGVVLFIVFKNNGEEPVDPIIKNRNKDTLEMKNPVVLYFSATGNTKQVAEYIKNEIGSDMIEIIPKEKYTDEDLNYGEETSRATQEQKNENMRPEIENSIDISKNDVIFLGYPIWWGDVPKIILTLFDNTDFKGKTIIPFCTSGSSDIDNSVKTLTSYKKDLNILKGKRFEGNVESKEIEAFVDGLNIKR